MIKQSKAIEFNKLLSDSQVQFILSQDKFFRRFKFVSFSFFLKAGGVGDIIFGSESAFLVFGGVPLRVYGFDIPRTRNGLTFQFRVAQSHHILIFHFLLLSDLFFSSRKGRSVSPSVLTT